MTASGINRRLLVAATVVGLAACRRAGPSTTQQREPTPPERADIPKIARQIPPREAIAGSNARMALLYSHAIPGMNARVEVREYYVSEGAAFPVPVASETLLEVLGGVFDVQAVALKGEQLKGTIWAVQPNERVVVRTTSQMAVLRAVSIIRQ
ncbi:MAG TPA: hypothetical protein VEL51_21160 [Vicinamibacterales bacterium]|nr:hypothetical protein [Vicinamibacterales bacterium]